MFTSQKTIKHKHSTGQVDSEAEYSQIDSVFSQNGAQMTKFRHSIKVKSNLHCTCGITPKSVTRSGAHLCGIAPGQHSSDETWRRWRAVGSTAYNSSGPGIEPQTSHDDSDVIKPNANRQVSVAKTTYKPVFFTGNW